jgi:catechol 2,3-dioxygenase-like lactoylglutathione lyase family enzyme
MNIDDLRPFIPCKDYAQSKTFYSALGFKVEDLTPELSICIKDKCTFFLQKFYHQALAENLMMQLIVQDIDDAFNLISAIAICDVKHSAIEQESWGKVIYLWGPSGELWHITELSSSN